MEGVVLSLLTDRNSTPALDRNGNQLTITTDAHGNYAFTHLLPGNYNVIQTQPNQYLSVGEVDDGDNPDNGVENLIPVTLDLDLDSGNDTGNNFVEVQGVPTAVSLEAQAATAPMSANWLISISAFITLALLTSLNRLTRKA